MFKSNFSPDHKNLAPGNSTFESLNNYTVFLLAFFHAQSSTFDYNYLLVKTRVITRP